MSTTVENYLSAYGTRELAAYALGCDLMRGDRATFKQGYTPANAAIAATELLGLDERQASELLEDLNGRHQQDTATLEALDAGSVAMERNAVSEEKYRAESTPEERGEEDAPHTGHFSRLGGTWWCDTCDSPYCDLA